MSQRSSYRLPVHWQGFLVVVVPLLALAIAQALWTHGERRAAWRTQSRAHVTSTLTALTPAMRQLGAPVDRSVESALRDQLRALPSVQRLTLYRSDRIGFFDYRRNSQPPAPAPLPAGTDQISFTETSVVADRALEANVGALAFARLEMAARPDQRARSQTLRSLSWMLLATFAVGALVLLFLRRSVTGPIDSLAAFVRDVAEKGDFEARAEPMSQASIDPLQRGVHGLLDRLGEEHDSITALNRELREAKERAEHANQEKSKFLARVNHELRTPLNGMIGVIELLRNQRVDEAQTAKYLDTAYVSGRHVIRIINENLDLARIEDGKLALRSQEFSLRESVLALEQMMSVQMQDKAIQFSQRVADDLPDRLLGDRDRLMQILINLVGNAHKFTNPGGQVSLAVTRLPDADGEREAASGDSDRVTMHFAVDDTGIGIRKDSHDNIFEAFAQADEAGANVREGTGLGLAICARLIALMGGAIGVESEVGSGSRFWFSVPFELAIRSSGERDPDAAEHPDPGQPAAALRVLLVDDNRINRMVADRLLKLDGHQVTNAVNGAQALALHQDEEFDVILMDVHMPVMDGHEATRRIRDREIGTDEHIPIIAITASSLSEEVALIFDSGMDDCISKPVTTESLRAVLAHVDRRG